jgi:hypothetical protein
LRFRSSRRFGEAFGSSACFDGSAAIFPEGQAQGRTIFVGETVLRDYRRVTGTLVRYLIDPRFKKGRRAIRRSRSDLLDATQRGALLSDVLVQGVSTLCDRHFPTY